MVLYLWKCFCEKDFFVIDDVLVLILIIFLKNILVEFILIEVNYVEVELVNVMDVDKKKIVFMIEK